MDKVKVIYGSTTGNTEDAEKQTAAAFGVDATAVSETIAAEANRGFCGLALDCGNEPQKTAGRILTWGKQLKS